MPSSLNPAIKGLYVPLEQTKRAFRLLAIYDLK